MLSTVLRAACYRGSLRAVIAQRIVRKLHFIPYPLRLSIDAVERPHYGHCVFNAVRLAKRLGHAKVSVIEFGVAGGNGLVNLEMHALEAEKHFGIGVEVYGFDTGEGLPAPADYRDLPYHWQRGDYKMDVAKLQSRLRVAKLVLGPVSETLPTFFKDHDPAPIGAIFVDVDFYSSAKDVLRIFEIGRAQILPRIHVYFDDIIGSDEELYCDYTGARLAIAEFNAENDAQKISKAYYLRANKYASWWWTEAVYIYHDFAHPGYTRQVSDRFQTNGATLALR